MKTMAVAVAVSVVLCTALAGEKTAVKFTKPPTARKANGKTVIEFAVSRQTDVAVWVLNAKGEVVRHLVAGVIGNPSRPSSDSGAGGGTPPEPLKPGLTQNLEWDGKDDDGKPASGGPFKVRVAACMKVSYGGSVFNRYAKGPNNLVAVGGLAVRPDGQLYVLAPRWTSSPSRSTAIHIFRRNGEYERTIMPMPSNLKQERLKGTGATADGDGQVVPRIWSATCHSFYPNTPWFPQHMTVSPAGDVVFASNRGGWVHRLKVDGSVAGGGFSKAPPVRHRSRDPHWTKPRLAISSDGLRVFMSGTKKGKWGKRSQPAIYEALLADIGKRKLFFGHETETGAGDDRLGGPLASLTLDGKGRLVVCDHANGRILFVDEKSGKLVSKLPVKAEWAAVHPKTGALYAVVDDHLVKYKLADGKPQEVARVSFASERKRLLRKKGNVSVGFDQWAEKPILWVGLDHGMYASRGMPIYPMRHFLYRVVDQGGRFGPLEPAGATPVGTFRYLSANPRGRNEVGCSTVMGYWILDERTGSVSRARSRARHQMSRLGPDGNIYTLYHAPGVCQKKPGPAFFRYDRKGKRVPFPKADAKWGGGLPVPGDGTTYWPRDFSVTRKGDIYVKIPGMSYHGQMSVEVFDKDGVHKRRVIWKTTDGGLGPRVDLQGNLYMADLVKTPGKPFPDWFTGRVSSKDKEYLWMYGSLLKFGPEGGVFGFKGGKLRPGAEPPKNLLPKTVVDGLDGYLHKGGYQKNMSVAGAKWMHDDFCRLGSNNGGIKCHCTGTDFDVDDFGRSFYPDQGRFRVVVRDTAGNLIRTIGAYGNQDNCGPDSYVLDPREKFYRPRRPDDPKDLVSPFAKPEIAFNWFIGMCVTDRNLYVADGGNRRVLKIRLGYEAEQTCAVR